MTAEQVRLVIQPDNVSLSVSRGTPLHRILDEQKISLNYFCGAKGKCGKCKVLFTLGAPTPTEEESALLDETEIEAGLRLACICNVDKDAEIEIPTTSRQHLLAGITADLEVTIEPLPPVRKFFLELMPQTLERPESDVDVVLKELEKQGIANPAISPEAISVLPRVLRQSDYRLTALLREQTVVRFETGDTTGLTCFGIAFDIGTTTVSGALFSLTEGRLIATTSRPNAQRSFGADLISRITYASEHDAHLDQLRRAVLDTMREIVGILCRKGQIAPDDILQLSMAGNSTMEHLLLGITPEYLGQNPFCPAFKEGFTITGAELARIAAPDSEGFVFPLIGGFVGGDIVADLLVTEIAERGEPALLVDIGTNGEVVLAKNGRLCATSAAAGPAFEGAQISQGMYASAGAIDHFTLKDGRVCFSTVEHAPAVGICGSGLIDIISELLAHGVIDASGRIVIPEEPADLNRLISDRISGKEGNQRILIAAAGDNAEHDVWMTQADIRQIQLAKGAIASAIEILMRMLDITPEDLNIIYLAGAFGNYIKEKSAVTIGLLPQVDLERIVFAGDAALSGASMALLNTNFEKKANRLAVRTEFVELATRPEFQDVFVDNLHFKNAVCRIS